MTKASGSDILRYEGNSGASPTEVIGAAGSGTIGRYSANFPFGITGNYSDIATGMTGAYSSDYAPALGTPNVSSTTGTKSPEQLRFEERRSQLIDAVSGMKHSAPNWSGATSVVREESADSAVRFLRCLSGDAFLPRVAPDGEGDIMFVWDGPIGNCVVTVEKRSLHLVSEPGTANVQQFGPLQFLGFRIPPTIMAHIPRK
jgi:hypothetical protein